jgi:hypothetical protein
VLFFAGDRAGMTADAAVLIDDKAVAHFLPFKSAIDPKKNLTLISENEKNGQGAMMNRARFVVRKPRSILEHQRLSQV